MSLQSYTFQPNGVKEASNYIEGFLIGTKQNENKWQVSKETLPKLVNGFVNTPFIIIPEKIAHNIDAHYHGATKEDTIEGYKKYSHGTIEKVLGPFSYNDGTDDFYYKHITKLSNSKAASILNEYGAISEIPFAVSPHIWQEDNELTDYVKNFVPIGVALVHKGAYGDIAVINKMCTGTKGQCHKSLGAANNHCGCCQNTDENIAKIVSSHFSKAANLNELSTNNTNNFSNSGNTGTIGTSTDATGTLITYNPNTSTSNPTVNPQNTLTKEPQKDPNQIVLTKEQYDAMTKQLKDSETFKTQLESLQNERNIEKVTQIFSPYVTDENVRNSLIEKYKANADLVKDFWSDIDKNIIPSIKESVKAELQKEINESAKTVSETNNNNKSKGAATNKTLRPEPKVTNNEEQSKAAATVTQNINEPKLLRKYLFGESD